MAPDEACTTRHEDPVRHAAAQGTCIRIALRPEHRDVNQIDVVLPVLDEVGALPWVLGRMPDGVHAIVADNGSTDGSADLARTLGAEVVTEPRRGFGAACWAGLHAATADVVCFMDCDGSLDPGDLPRIFGPVVRDEADLVLAARHADRGAWPLPARVANRAIALELRRRTGIRLHDLGPMRAARRRALLDLGIEDRRFGWPLEMVVRAQAAGWRIAEDDVRYRSREGRSKVTGTVRGFARTVRDMAEVLP
jgi:glycosyltransferase involved in cell wall biosynthesis